VMSYETYIIPNARCPVCKKSVFFYESPNGGRVFFDELGPPWPKHSCTDNQKENNIKSIAWNYPMETIPVSDVRINNLDNEYGVPKWKQNGWHPVIVRKDSGRIENLFRIYKIINTSRFTLETKLYNKHADEIMYSYIVFVQRKERNTFTIAMFDLYTQLSTYNNISTESINLDQFFK
jgi:hypothetical protein